MADPPPAVRVLVVCLGNICRSPMAEGLLRARIDTSGLRGHVQVDSVGTGDWHVGRPPDPRAIATMSRHGIDIASLRARQLTDDDYRCFDWLLCADRNNLDDVRARAPAHLGERASLLLSWSAVNDGEPDVPDPYTGNDDDFERVFQLLDRAASGVVGRLMSQLEKR